MDKLILDCKASNMGVALRIYFELSPLYPDQQVGEEHAILQDVGETKMALIRNEGSYTVKEL